MQPQLILRIVGIAALVVAALFAVLAVHYYITRNIRAVMDDLSGKTRAQGVAGARTRAAADSRRGGTSRTARRTASAPTPASPAPEVPPVRESPQDAAPSAAPQPVVFEDEDDMGTVLVDALHAGDAGTAADVRPPVAAVAQEAGEQPLFRLTRSIVMIHSQEVIATSEEPLV